MSRKSVGLIPPPSSLNEGSAGNRPYSSFMLLFLEVMMVMMRPHHAGEEAGAGIAEACRSAGVVGRAPDQVVDLAGTGRAVLVVVVVVCGTEGRRRIRTDQVAMRQQRLDLAGVPG